MSTSQEERPHQEPNVPVPGIWQYLKIRESSGNLSYHIYSLKDHCQRRDLGPPVEPKSLFLIEKGVREKEPMVNELSIA